VLDAVGIELRMAVRTLRNAPSFSAAAILTVALGIGASTAIFSVVYGILLRPLPYRDVDRLVVVTAERDYSGRPRPEPTNFGLSDVVEWQKRAQTLASVAFMSGNSYSLADTNGARTVDAADVTGSFFSTLGGPMAIGRGFADGDANAIVISHRLWDSRFGGSPSALGATLTLNARPYTIVGVAAPEFQIPTAQKDVWVLAPPPNPNPARRGVGGFTPIARVKPGATLAQAASDAQRVIDSLNRDFPGRYDHIRATAVSLQDQVVGAVRAPLLMLLAAVGLVLFVACANVANLMIARNTSRARDAAVRRALGASRGRLLVQSIADAAVIVSIGGLAGLVAAVGLVRAAVRFAPLDTPQLTAIRVDWPILAFAAVAAGATALVAGALPAFERAPAADALKTSGATASSHPAQRRVRTLLIVAELAVSVVLLVGATLLGRSLAQLLRTDLGISTDHVAAALLDLTYGRTLTPEQQIGSIDRVVARVRSLPGVVDAAATASLPPNAGRLRITMTTVDDADRPMANYLVDAVTVTPGFFSALRVPLVQGRFFAGSDDAQHPPVMIMSADTARMLFKDPNPIGRSMSLPSTVRRGAETVTLVGVIANIKYSGLDAAPNGAIYRPFAQQPWPSMFVLARTSGDPAPVARALAGAVADVDPAITFSRSNTLDGMVSDAVSQPRFRTALMASCAVLALMLAAAGLYGVIAYAVSRRTTEIGIRMALGAGAGDVVTLVLREGMKLALAGLATGVVAAMVLTRFVSGLLYGVAPTDPLSFVGSTVVLFGLALIATYVPARRAAHVDPLVALRAE